MRQRRRPVTTTAPLGAATTSSRVVPLPWKDAASDKDASAKRAIGATRETTPRGRRSPSRRSRSLVSWRSADRAARGAGRSWARRGDPYKDSATLIAAAAAAGARGAASGCCCAAAPPLRRTAARGAAAAAAESPFFRRGSSPSPREDNPGARAFFRRSEEEGFASIIPPSSSVRSQRRSPQRAGVRTSSIPPCARPQHPSRSGRCPLLRRDTDVTRVAAVPWLKFTEPEQLSLGVA